MAPKVSLPTVFLPMAPKRAKVEKTAPHSIAWDLSPESPDTQQRMWIDRPPAAWETDHTTRTIKRPRAQVKTTDKSILAARLAQSTISTYLHEHFSKRPVCILTRAGRFSGTIIEVDDRKLTLATESGEPLTLAIDALLSIGEVT